MLRALAVVVAIVAVGCGSKEGAAAHTARARQRQARDVARRAGLPANVQDFLAVYASAAGNRFGVTYARSGSGATVVLLQDPPLRRVDVIAPPVTRSVLVTRGGTFDCALDNQKWTCQRAPVQERQPGLLAPADITRTVTELQAARTNYTFRVTSRKVAGVTARCLLTVPRPTASGRSTSTLCISGEGAVLLLDGVANPLRAERYTTDVDSRRLELPAKPEPTLPPP